MRIFYKLRPVGLSEKAKKVERVKFDEMAEKGRRKVEKDQI